MAFMWNIGSGVIIRSPSSVRAQTPPTVAYQLPALRK